MTRNVSAMAAARQGDMITAIHDDGSFYAIDKLDAHVRDVHHVAISVFLFSEGRMLLQRRALDKYHSGGLWANSCCSHPMPDESADDCAKRRLFEELGIDASLKQFHTIRYRARVGALFENETAHCYYGFWDAGAALPAPNPKEVCATRWMTLAEIVADVGACPDNYSAWFKIYLSEHHAKLVSVPWSLPS